MMQVNNALQFQVPDGFQEMNAEETAGMLLTEGGEGVALSSQEKHLILSVGWKKAGGFSSLVLNSGDLREKMEQSIQKAMKQLNYRETGEAEITVGGLQADGFSYQYTAVNGTEMAAESYVLKRKNDLYYFHMYSRRELVSENSALVREILRDASWIM